MAIFHLAKMHYDKLFVQHAQILPGLFSGEKKMTTSLGKGHVCQVQKA